MLLFQQSLGEMPVIYSNINLFLKKYPDLKINSSKTFIEGKVCLDMKYNDVYFCKEYKIIIDISKKDIPYIKEIDGKIDCNYPHRYKDGGLCLATNSDIILSCLNDDIFDIDCWFEKYVKSYFFTYEFYQRFGYYPFGERSHGAIGILEFYQDFFNVDSPVTAMKCLNFTIASKYAGHLLCPCGSGKKIRNCHSKELYNAKNERIMKFIIQDRLKILEEVKKINEYNKCRSK